MRVTDEGMTLPDPAARPLDWATEWRDLDAFEEWLVARLTAAPAPPPRRISRATLEDKVRGGWAGQMIGVAFGAPTEFKSNGKILEGELRWTPEMIANTIHQDDLYVEMTFAEVMDRVGLDATTEQYGEMFRDSKYSLWHANAGARRNLNRGIKAPMSGHPDFNVHANDIDFQIESDFIGLMCPGLPQASNHYADRVGRVMNYGDGLYGGMFFGAMYAAAFFETDPHTRGRAGTPGDSRRERLRAARPRRARLARAGPDRLAQDLAPDRGEVGPARPVPGRGARALQHRRPPERGLRRPGPPLRGRRLREDARDRHAGRAGLRLQPVERRGDPRRDARLRAHPGDVEGAGSPRSPTRSSSSRATPSTRSWHPRWRAPRR